MTDAQRKLNRTQLYELVWISPITKLAEEYGLSDVGLSKICRKYQIPLPPRGYWAKLAAGKNTIKPRLPNPHDNPEIRVIQSEQVSSRVKQSREASMTRRQLAEDIVGTIAVPDALSKPHLLTRKTQQFYQDVLKKKQRQERLKDPWRLEWSQRAHDEYGRYRCSSSDGYSLMVSFDLLNRALIYLDTLVKALEQHGFEIQPDIHSKQHKKDLVAYKEGEGIAFHLAEGYRRQQISEQEHKLALKKSPFAVSYERVPSGKLTLTTKSLEFWNERRWTDGSNPIEHKLAEVVAEFLRLVTRQKQQRAEHQEEMRRQAERARIQAEIRTRRELRIKEYDSTFSEAMQYFELKKLEDYLNQLECEYKFKHGDLEGNVLDWFRMMREMIEKKKPLPHRIQYLIDLSTRPLEDIGWRNPP